VVAAARQTTSTVSLAVRAAVPVAELEQDQEQEAQHHRQGKERPVQTHS
jgi:hypothetical protein